MRRHNDDDDYVEHVASASTDDILGLLKRLLKTRLFGEWNRNA